MKKSIKVLSLILGVILISMGLVVAYNQEPSQDIENNRFLVKSNNGVLKAMFNVHHNFDKGFTTDLSLGQLKVLERLGIEVEQVEIYSITARPICGDGRCHPVKEDAITCPEDCSTQPPVEPFCGDGICNGDETTETCSEDCSAEPEPTECFPDNQIPWGINKVNGGVGGNGIVVAVLDTGVDQDHPDLVGNIIDCVAFRYRTCEDGNGHGTHVAGTILANGNIIGVAPQAKLMAIKILKDNGRGYTDDIAAGIYYATDHGANIISMSLGGSESSLINEAVDYAVSNNVLVIASAGNSGPSEGSILYPAANPEVVAVAAFWESDNMADFSSRGINDGDWVVEEREIEFTAPGVYVESTYKDGCYAVYSGTSMAAPHITGIAARDWQESASLTRTHLQSLAESYTLNVYDYGQSGDDIEAGLGLPI